MPLPTDSSIHINSTCNIHHVPNCRLRRGLKDWPLCLRQHQETMKEKYPQKSFLSLSPITQSPPLLLQHLESPCPERSCNDTSKKYLCYRSLCTAISPIVSRKTSHSHQASEKCHPKSQPKSFPIQERVQVWYRTTTT